MSRRTNTRESVNAFFEVLREYPGRVALAGVALGAFIIHNSGDTSTSKVEKPTPTTSMPFSDGHKDWEPRFTVTSQDGSVLDIACRGNVEITVETGQTLGKIASGIETKTLGQDLPDLSQGSVVAILAKVNKISNPDYIRSGQNLVLAVECAAMDVTVG